MLSPSYYRDESLNETNGSVYVPTPPTFVNHNTNDMTEMAVVTIAEHDNFNNHTVIVARAFHPGL